MQMTKKDLRKILYDFNSVSNRLLQSDSDNYLSALQRFLEYLNSQELIKNYMESQEKLVLGFSDEEIHSIFKELAVSLGHQKIQLSGIVEEEIKCTHKLLVYILEQHVPFNSSFFYSFSTSSKFDDKIKGFNEKISKILIIHIEDYLTKLGIDMGMDDSTVFNISNNQGQVNIAQDNSNIDATQIINNEQFNELDILVEKLLENLKELPSVKDKCYAEENATFIKEELMKDNPRKSVVSGCIETLKRIAKKVPDAVEFAASVAGIANFVMQFIR